MLCLDAFVLNIIMPSALFAIPSQDFNTSLITFWYFSGAEHQAFISAQTTMSIKRHNVSIFSIKGDLMKAPFKVHFTKYSTLV